MATDLLTLREAAEELGVHYMTAYRYVRLGVLPAHKEGSTWRVARRDVRRIARRSTPRSRARRGADWKGRLLSRLLAGDDAGAWQVVETAMAAGTTPHNVYLKILVPAMHAVGHGWETGDVSVAEEHRATAVATRLIGRLGPQFARRGRTRGSVVIATPPGELHGLATAIIADLLRAAGFEVVDLGANVPPDSLADLVAGTPRLVAVAISVSGPEGLAGVEPLIDAVRQIRGDVPVLIGGRAIRDAEHATALGADGYAADGGGVVAAIEAMMAGRS